RRTPSERYTSRSIAQLLCWRAFGFRKVRFCLFEPFFVHWSEPALSIKHFQNRDNFGPVLLGIAAAHPEPPVGQRKVVLPARIGGIGFGQALADAEAVLIGFERLSTFALVPQHIAHFLVAYCEIALPARIAGISLGQALADSEAVLIG